MPAAAAPAGDGLRDRDADWAGAALGAAPSPTAADPLMRLEDVLALRDISGLSLSPDGRWLAFGVRQADAARNAYAFRWFVMPSSGAASPQPIDGDGGEPIPAQVFGLPQAAILPARAAWSPDSRHVAFRRKIGDRIELWIAEAATRRARRVADGAAQVTKMAWIGPEALAFTTGLNHDRYVAQVAREAERGWRLDGRMPLFAARTPSPPPPDCRAAPADPACENLAFVAEPGGRVRPATSAEAQAMRAEVAPRTRRPDATAEAVSRPRCDGAQVWATNLDPATFKGYAAPHRLVTDAPHASACASAACVGRIFASGWSQDQASAWFLKRQSSQGGDRRGPYDQYGLYEWRLRDGRVRPVHVSDDVLQDCDMADGFAWCVRETETRPAHIVRIAAGTGEVRVIADPNPQLQRKRLPEIRKLILTDPVGNRAFAKVVYPPGARRDGPRPVVVVQYSAKGFLRGGTGGEYPILPFAAEDWIVLVFDRPEPWLEREVDDITTVERRRQRDLRDRRMVLAALEEGLDTLVAEGSADPNAIAITGLSSGAEVVHYALQRSDRFAVGIASSGAHDVSFLALVNGDNRRRLQANFEVDGVVPPPGNPLRQLAWSERPDALRAPLLVNVGQYEAMLGFEGLQALHDRGRPLEVRVFPDEFHIKYHPRSLAGAMRNNLAWLRFWLDGRESPDLAEPEDYGRWRAMRAKLQAEAAARR